ncbi:hypothetical protein V4U94_005062 [Candida albicans]|uniref:Uncharacterized protein n=1 Tax=Candida albicans (strain WO-1) TaxID=294748 RepID=C4YRQ9_CANAW|nr:conserved hypothetical protein [Candida albicans WO-1]KGQ86791.1 hypothetical protein MEU_04331 [Candida albicans P37005]KGT66962.1 hypothetical protein MEK_04334 [Candida albicans 12C]KHC32896.1 hypothetical protein MGO_04297 [Candida albicans P76055]KHC51221.1 hypothetical protein MGC_04330 [Candida albicans P37039]KHC75282.1 hypothetical protein W5Q_04410 [Candida albicans SC5314]
MNDNFNSSNFSSFKNSPTLLTSTNEQLNRLWNLILKFDRISITSTDINIEDTDNNSSTGDDQFISIEKFYKLLINYHKLIELITIKNNELTIMKFQCFEIIRNIQQQQQQQKPNTHKMFNQHNSTATYSSSFNETGKKLQDIFNPKEEFDSTI